MTQESNVKTSLAALGLTVADIDVIAMTHLHFDHACGLTEYEGEQLISVFPNAVIYASAVEWNEMRHPNIRSKIRTGKKTGRQLPAKSKPLKTP